MKKVLIGIIVLIPVLILACISLVGNIVSTKAYIDVEEITLNKSEYTFENVGDSFKLSAVISPRFATDQEVRYYILQNGNGEDDIVLLDDRFDTNGDVKAAEVSDDGLVTVNTYCSFTVVCESTSSSVKAFCIVNVKQGKIEGLVPKAVKSVIKRGERTGIELHTNPVDAVIDGVVEWTSLNPEVATVDANGIVEGVSEGTAVITAKITTADGETEGRVSVAVSGGSFKKEVFYVSGDSVDLSDIAYVTDGFTVSGGTIDDGKLVLTSNEAEVFVGSDKAIVKRVDQNAIGFANADLLEGKKLFLSKASVNLKVVYLASGAEAEDVEILSSDETVARIENGNVVALSVGSVTFTAQVGGYTAVLTMKVERPVVYFYLNAREASDMRGIAQTTVYGNKSFVDKNGEEYNAETAVEYTRSFSVTSPSGLSADEFVWSTDKPDIAWFDESEPGVLHYAENIDGIQEITVKAVAKNPLYESKPAERTYTFKVTNAYNTYNKNDFKGVIWNLKAPVCMQGNAVVKEGEEGGAVPHPYYLVQANIYGNGYLVANYNYSEASKNSEFLTICKSDVTVSNLTVRLREPVDEISEKNTFGKGITVATQNNPQDGQFKLKDLITNVRIEYCVVEYCRQDIVFFGGEGTVTGCIIRNAAKYGLFSITEKTETEAIRYNTIDVENCLFSNLNGTGIGMTCYSTSEDDAPIEEDGVEYRMYSTLNLKGFVDFYNWKSVDDLDILGEVTGNETMDKSLANYVKNIIKGEEFDEFRYAADDGQEYVCLSIILSGLMHPSTSEVYVNGELDDETNMYDTFRLTSRTESIMSLWPMTFYSYSYDETEITPDSVLKIDNEYYRQLCEGR